jgi:hypothetical protein
MKEEERKSVYEIGEETYEEIKKEIEKRKRDAEAKGKRYYTPFAIGQEGDEYPVRAEQIDMLEQTAITWLACPQREYAYLQHRIGSKAGFTIGAEMAWLDGEILAHGERSRWPLKHDEIVFPVVTLYNHNDMAFKGFTTGFESYCKWVFDNVPVGIGTLSCILFDMYGEGYFTYKPLGIGSRCQSYSLSGLGAFVSTHPAYDAKVFPLWEDIRWKKADIKKIKANIWLLKNPTLIRAKKAEIKKIKADNWIYKHVRFIRMSRWKYQEIWELKEEIKRLKKEGRGEERIEEIEEPTEYMTNREHYKTQSRYLYPHILNKEKMKLKNIAEYKDEIRGIKEEIRQMKEERKRRIKEGIKRGKDWLKEHREYARAFKELEKSPRIRNLRQRWKDREKWVLETSKKRNIEYDAYIGGELEDAPEIKKILSELYIPTETDFERKVFGKIRGAPQRENMLLAFAQRKWRCISVRRMLENKKGHGLGKVAFPNVIDEIISKESRGYYDFNVYVFRTSHFNRGMGEWKELTRDVRKKIPFPLVHRPIKDEKGYTIMDTDWEYGTVGRWECRPLHQRDAWHPWCPPLWSRLYTYTLWLISRPFMNKWVTWWTSAAAGAVVTGAPHRWPLYKLYVPYHPVNRLALAFFYRFWA